MITNRIDVLLKLKDYILQNDETVQSLKENAERQNGWFTQAFIELALQTICTYYLNEEALTEFAKSIQTAEEKGRQQTVGITMAGNIPLVGFHDFLCVFLSGHKQRIKFSTKDDVLLPHFMQKLYEWDDSNLELVSASEMLKGCDAYIATGSNNSAKYFEFYFAKYPHIIRRNRTSIAILDGNETEEELEQLADDIYQYFGLGCRNVTKLYVPETYDFIPMLAAFRKYDHLKHHNKFRNNLDYNLALYILNNQLYMSSESILVVEHQSIFSAIAVVHYEQYSDNNKLIEQLHASDEIQAIIGHGHIPFGKAQTPSIFDFADNVNTIHFLNTL
jgi:hypothetical protein